MTKSDKLFVSYSLIKASRDIEMPVIVVGTLSYGLGLDIFECPFVRLHGPIILYIDPNIQLKMTNLDRIFVSYIFMKTSRDL